MRHDMYKVIIDEPRPRSSTPNRKTRLRLNGKEFNSLASEQLEDHDSGPDRMGMSMNSKHRDRSSDSKDFSDRLGPLRRFLRSRVGRPWNAVHSEISNTLDNRTLVRGKHFWDHITGRAGEVDADCFIDVDGTLTRAHSWRRFYVHPVTGLLCYEERESFRLHPSAPFMDRLAAFGFARFKDRRYANENKLNWYDFRIVDDRTVLEFKHNAWFIHSFRVRVDGEFIRTYLDTEGRLRSAFYRKKEGKDELVSIGCRQIGKRDLKRYADIIARNPF